MYEGDGGVDGTLKGGADRGVGEAGLPVQGAGDGRGPGGRG